MAGKRKKRQNAVLLAVLLAAIVASPYLVKHLLGHHRSRAGNIRALYPYHPEISTLAPGAATAIRKALGPSGLDRVTQIISPGDQPSLVSGGTHMQSGVFHGHPYGLAFDIAVPSDTTADKDTRALRLQGIAAWFRAPGSPDGVAGNGPHIHCVWPGATTSNPQNLEQIASFVHGYRALADEGKPLNEWKDRSITRDEIARVAHIYRLAHPKTPLADITPYDALHRGRDATLASVRTWRRNAGG
jgi:hypothetical protein